MAAVTICSDFGAKKTIKSVTVSIDSPSICHEVMGPDSMILVFLGSKITADGDRSHEIKMLIPWKKSYDHARQHIKKQRHYFANKGASSQSYGFPGSHVWM